MPKNIYTMLTNFSRGIFDFLREIKSAPLYKIASIEKTDEDYIATIQMKNTSNTMRMKPEEILSDDKLTDSFSPRDIRTLTYLGYLGINSPQYQILAQRLSEHDSKLLFILKEKGNKKVFVKTADELSADKELLNKLSQADAHSIGYTSGAEIIQSEKEKMKQLIANKKVSHK